MPGWPPGKATRSYSALQALIQDGVRDDQGPPGALYRFTLAVQAGADHGKTGPPEKIDHGHRFQFFAAGGNRDQYFNRHYNPPKFFRRGLRPGYSQRRRNATLTFNF